MAKQSSSFIVQSIQDNILEQFLEKHKINKDIFFLAALVLVMLTGFIFCKGHYSNLLTDFGREMIFPEAIVNGKVLYKDILCIYFPFAYQINALVFKLFGINLSVLEYFGLINAFLFTITIFFIAKEFLKYEISCLFALTTAIAVTFNGSLFNFLLPYSSSMSYGSTAFLISTLFLIKFIKNQRQKYLNLAFLAGGAALAFKSEYVLLFAVLLFVLLTQKPRNLTKSAFNILLYCLVPLLSFGTLFVQGMSCRDFYAALLFMKKFFTTSSMLYHIGRTGGIFRIEDLGLYWQCILGLLIFWAIAFLFFKLSQKIHKSLWFTTLFFPVIFVNITNVSLHTVILPISVFIFLIFNFKKLYSDKALFVLIIAALALNIRMFWSLILTLYGMYTAPLLVLSLIVITIKYLPDLKYLTKSNIQDFISYLLISYFLFFTGFAIYQSSKNNTPLISARGKIYLPKEQAVSLSSAIQYIEKYTKQNDKILVLPEGSVINFLANRPVDLKMHMADRLYSEAIGEEKVAEKIKSADYELILIIKGYGLTNFGKPYLYDDNNRVIKFLDKNYQLDWETKYIEKSRPNTIKCYVKPY